MKFYSRPILIRILTFHNEITCGFKDRNKKSKKTFAKFNKSCIFALAIDKIELQDILRGGAVVARRAHNPKVVSSSLAPAT